MKIISVIGTRPQYIKLKPFYDFCKTNGIDHIVLDTLQHYSDNVSSDLIKDLDLEIDISLHVRKDSEWGFMSETLDAIGLLLRSERPDYVLVYGDTNSTLCAALAAYKLKIPVAHVEAGLRCGDVAVPEEVNRIFADTVSRLKFCSSHEGLTNLEDGIYCGDLEYEMLGNINPVVEKGDYGVMTIHRQSNTTIQQMQKILEFCSTIPHPIRFYVHHRTMPLLKKLKIPHNIETFESCPYSTMVENLAGCKFILTDSGGIQKTAPFFGKKALVFREKIEWVETETAGYIRKADYSVENLNWLLLDDLKRDTIFYMHKDKKPSEIMYESIINSLGRSE